MTEKIFVNGLFMRKPEPDAPKWIKGKLSIEAFPLIKFLESMRPHLSEKGWLNVDLKESAKGNLYFEVNTWKPEKDPELEALRTEHNENVNKIDEPVDAIPF